MHIIIIPIHLEHPCIYVQVNSEEFHFDIMMTNNVLNKPIKMNNWKDRLAHEGDSFRFRFQNRSISFLFQLCVQPIPVLQEAQHPRSTSQACWRQHEWTSKVGMLSICLVHLVKCLHITTYVAKHVRLAKTWIFRCPLLCTCLIGCIERAICIDKEVWACRWVSLLWCYALRGV